MSRPLVLAIETSCDETAVALLRAPREILASEIASQIHLHKQYGGVVPEVASRNHLPRIRPLDRDRSAAFRVFSWPRSIASPPPVAQGYLRHCWLDTAPQKVSQSAWQSLLSASITWKAIYCRLSFKDLIGLYPLLV